MKDTDEATYVAATPIKISKNGKVVVGESTIIKPEKDLIVLKKNKGVRK